MPLAAGVAMSANERAFRMHAESAEQPTSPTGAPDAASTAPPRRAPWALLRRVDVLFLALLAFGALLRFYGVNWDQGTHIHPDERFLTMAGNALKLPTSLGQYLDPQSSPLNPTIAGCDQNGCPYAFFVYGILPITLNKIVAVLLHNDTYDMFTLQGRVLSAIADVLTLVFLYFAVRLLEQRRSLAPQIKYLAVFAYAIAVLPIQLAHFFAVDSFLNLFTFGSFYFALRYSLRGDWLNVCLGAVFLGCAIASKTSGLAILPLDLYLILSRLFPEANGDLGRVLGGLIKAIRERRSLPALLIGGAELVLVFGLITYLALRLADPYYFQSANLLDPRLNQQFLHNLDILRGYDTPAAVPGYPPAVQWVAKLPITFALTNLAIFGVGVPLFVLVALGGYVTWAVKQRTELLVILVWVVLFFVFQSAQFVKTMRYFIFLYPFLAIYAALGFHALVTRWPRFLQGAVALSLLIWPLAFMSIYVHDHSRVQASRWMYQNLPNNSYIVSESWDDPLPLLITNSTGKTFPGGQIDSFNADLITNPNGQQALDPSKWNKIESELRRGSYLVLSSNRGWGSIPTLPRIYPRMTRFYQDLFAGRPVFAGVVYRRIATFTSYPSLRYLGIPIDFPDQWSEEAFTVYDHPEVIIFEHVR